MMSYDTLDELAADAKIGKISKETAQHELVALLIRQLSAEGLDEDNINKNYRKLSLDFHPDRKQNETVLYLNQYFSKDGGSNSNFLFVLLGMAKEELLQDKGIEFKSLDDLNKWLDKKINQYQKEQNNTAMVFYMGIKNMVISAQQFSASCDALAGTHGYASMLLKVMPGVLTGAVVSFAAKELALIYGASAVLIYLGKKIEENGSELHVQNLEDFGIFLKDAGVFLFLSSTRLLTTVFAITCETSQYTLGAAASLLSITSQSQELLDAKTWEQKFISDNMKIIVRPLLDYMRTLDSQSFRVFRSGEPKRVLLDKLMRELDAIQHQPANVIWIFVGNILNNALNNEGLTGAGKDAKLAIERAKIGLSHVTNPVPAVGLMQFT